MKRAVLFFLLSMGVISCSSKPRELATPSEITGTVTLADGKPVKDVQMGLRPLGEGQPTGCVIKSDGTFTAQAIPGEFMFFFGPIEDPKFDKAKAKVAFAAIPSKYHEATMEHTVRLNAGTGNKVEVK